MKEVKAGRIDFRVDRYGIVHVGVGKSSFGTEQLRDNVNEVLRTIVRMRPASVKGTYVQKITVSSTMSPGVKIDRVNALNALK